MAIEVFISYAHEDKTFRKALNNQLMPLKRVGLVSVWHDRMIAAGTEWESQIDAALERCQIVLLLVSPNGHGDGPYNPMLTTSICTIKKKRWQEQGRARNWWFQPCYLTRPDASNRTPDCFL
ncbi:MAG: toll/interleukin-1 receptor domain-containing protein [Magnetococcales bacterium]|nr:toll/interleukin-1 receptor domain-containing protein [Magnetococcales bacterium]